MKVLSQGELRKAEEALGLYFPQSQEAYGYVFLMNRVEVEPTDVLVDQWPDFNVLLIRPKMQQIQKVRDICVFTKNESSLRTMINRTDFLDWKPYLSLSVDLLYGEMFKTVAVNRGVPMTEVYPCHLMCLKDPSKLTRDRSSFQVSSVQESDIALINSKWKYAMAELTMPMISNMIRNFPSCCVRDSEGHPVSWILTYASCAIGMLYTLPEHRRKGYAKALVTELAKKLYSEGYPVYCFIEEDNEPSYRLFTSLGFSGDPYYRAAYLESIMYM